MTRQIVVVVTTDGRLSFAGDDLPDFTELIELVGRQTLDETLTEIGLDVEINSHLCG